MSTRSFLAALLLALSSLPALADSGLSACPIAQKETGATLSQILEAEKGIHLLRDSRLATACSSSKNGKNLSQFQRKLVAGYQSSSEEKFDFALDLWRESMRTLLVNQIDLETRFEDQSSNHKKFDAAHFVNRLCQSDRGEDFCQTGPYPQADEKQKFIEFARSVLKAYSKIPKINAEDLATGLSFHVGEQQAAQTAYNPLVYSFQYRNLIPVDQTAYKRSQGVESLKEEDGKQAAAKAAQHYLESKLRGTTTSGLNYSSLYFQVSPFLATQMMRNKMNGITHGHSLNSKVSVSAAQQALMEFKNAYRSIGLSMGHQLSMAMMPNGFASQEKQRQLLREKKVNTAWIIRMIQLHPAAVAQYLSNNPEKAGLVCSILKGADGAEKAVLVGTKIMDGAMVASMVVSGGLLVPGVLGVRMGIAATSTLTTLAAVNSSAATTLFVGNVAKHWAQHSALFSDLQQLQKRSLAGTGVRPEDLGLKKIELKQANELLISDVAFSLAPFLTKSITIHPSVTQSATQALSNFLSAKDSQIIAGIKLLLHSCGALDERCGLLMAAFNSKSLKEKEAILRSPKEIEKLAKSIELNKKPNQELAENQKTSPLDPESFKRDLSNRFAAEFHAMDKSARKIDFEKKILNSDQAIEWVKHSGGSWNFGSSDLQVVKNYSSSYPKEREVLFGPGSRFVIQDVQQHPSGTVMVRMLESVPSDQQNARPPSTGPADVRPADVRPADVRPADVRPADVRPADVRRVIPPPAGSNPSGVKNPNDHHLPAKKPLTAAERYLNPETWIEACRENARNKAGDPPVSFSTQEQARNYLIRFSGLQHFGFTPLNQLEWAKYKGRMGSSAGNGQVVGWEQKQENGNWARIRLDYSPKEGAHYNIETRVETRPGRFETFNLLIKFNCTGKPCSEKQYQKLVQQLN